MLVAHGSLDLRKRRFVRALRALPTRPFKVGEKGAVSVYGLGALSGDSLL